MRAIIAAGWLYFEPGFEPAITLLVATTALLAETISVSKQNSKKHSVLSLALSPLRKWRAKVRRKKEMARPAARISFDTLWEAKSVHHEVAIWLIWDDESPTEQIELPQKAGKGSWTTVNIITGFFPKNVGRRR